MTDQRTAWGWGLSSVDAAGNTLDVWYPELKLGEAPEEVARPNHNFGNLAHEGVDARGVRRIPVFTVSKLDEPIEDAADAYLRLHLLSMRLAKPNTLNLDGIFAALNNVVWTNYGPFAVEDFALRKLDVMAAANQCVPGLPKVDVNVLSIDKFPRMVDYVVPTGVRIGDADRVRLGAHLSEGTTPARSAFPWWKAVFPKVLWSATVPISAAAHPSWAPCPVAASLRTPSASTPCLARTRASASPSATTAWLKPVCM